MISGTKDDSAENLNLLLDLQHELPEIYLYLNCVPSQTPLSSIQESVGGQCPV
jgi:hypothetical protein